jgi:micrococcal nuclease
MLGLGGNNMRRGLIVLLAVAALAVPAAASAKVKLVSVTSPARAGSYATLTPKVSPTATCKIVVMYKSGSSHASGLYSKRPTFGVVSWTWMVGTNTTSGRWPIYVCGTAGALQTSFVVR